MSRNEFLACLDELFELSPGTLKGPEQLTSLESWDSLKVIHFIALADEKLSASVKPEKVAKSKTVDDLIALCGDAVRG